MKKINGKLNLSKIPKRLIKTDSKGNSYIYVDVIETRNEKLRSNNCTHTMELWDKEDRPFFCCKAGTDAGYSYKFSF